MADIFRLADRVIAWVGPEADDSSCALETFVSVGARIEVDWTLRTLRPATSEEVDSDWADATRIPLLSRRKRSLSMHSSFVRDLRDCGCNKK
jgi:hypothetical protein